MALGRLAASFAREHGAVNFTIPVAAPAAYNQTCVRFIVPTPAASRVLRPRDRRCGSGLVSVQEREVDPGHGSLRARVAVPRVDFQRCVGLRGSPPLRLRLGLPAVSAEISLESGKLPFFSVLLPVAVLQRCHDRGVWEVLFFGHAMSASVYLRVTTSLPWGIALSAPSCSRILDAGTIDFAHLARTRWALPVSVADRPSPVGRPFPGSSG